MSRTEFDFEAVKAGCPLQTVSGTPMRFIAHVPEAVRHQRLIVLDITDGAIETYSAEGRYFSDSNPSSMDLITLPWSTP